MEKRKILLKCFQVERQSSPTYRNQIYQRTKKVKWKNTHQSFKRPTQVTLPCWEKPDGLQSRGQLRFCNIVCSHIHGIQKNLQRHQQLCGWHTIISFWIHQYVTEQFVTSLPHFWRHHRENFFATATGARGDVLGGRTISHTAASRVFVHGTKNGSRVLKL